jgi:hypothetical protein
VRRDDTGWQNLTGSKTELTAEEVI